MRVNTVFKITQPLESDFISVEHHCIPKDLLTTINMAAVPPQRYVSTIQAHLSSIVVNYIRMCLTKLIEIDPNFQSLREMDKRLLNANVTTMAVSTDLDELTHRLPVEKFQDIRLDQALAFIKHTIDGNNVVGSTETKLRDIRDSTYTTLSGLINPSVLVKDGKIGLATDQDIIVFSSFNEAIRNTKIFADIRAFIKEQNSQ